LGGELLGLGDGGLGLFPGVVEGEEGGAGAGHSDWALESVFQQLAEAAEFR
jgi:hypothetical protein